MQGLLDLAVGADAALADPDVSAVVGHQRGAGVLEGALVVGEIHGREGAERAGKPRLLKALYRVRGNRLRVQPAPAVEWGGGIPLRAPG